MIYYKLTALMIFLVLFSALNGQSNETVSINVKVSLKKGLSVLCKDNNLNFGEIIIQNSFGSLNKSPNEGLRLKIVSHPCKPVLISFDNICLVASESLENDINNGAIFIPEVFHTGPNSDYVNPVQVCSGTYYNPQTQTGQGILNLWIGGKLLINREAAAGNYSGKFSISITY